MSSPQPRPLTRRQPPEHCAQSGATALPAPQKRPPRERRGLAWRRHSEGCQDRDSHLPQGRGRSEAGCGHFMAWRGRCEGLGLGPRYERFHLGLRKRQLGLLHSEEQQGSRQEEIEFRHSELGPESSNIIQMPSETSFLRLLTFQLD